MTTPSPDKRCDYCGGVIDGYEPYYMRTEHFGGVAITIYQHVAHGRGPRFHRDTQHTIRCTTGECKP